MDKKEFSMKLSEFEIFLPVESLNKKIDENCRNSYVAEKRIVPNYKRNWFKKKKTQIEN